MHFFFSVFGHDHRVAIFLENEVHYVLHPFHQQHFLPLAFRNTTKLAQRDLFCSLENYFYSETLEKVF